ncbi:hypothetical protein [Schlesneria sp. T3-172]|uniref:hypothetical protein n=1 Tax=Schlesneria sphaerica TaxID=3373610 RepID=UPI0037CC0364
MKYLIMGVLTASWLGFWTEVASAQRTSDRAVRRASAIDESADSDDPSVFNNLPEPALPPGSLNDVPAGTDPGVPPTFFELSSDAAPPSTRFGAYGDTYDDPRGFKYSWNPDQWAKVGAALRASFNSQTRPSPNDLGSYFTLNNMRLLTSGQVTKYVGFELNSDINLSETVTPQALTVPTSFSLLDAILKLETSDYFNVWLGQFLPPSDRSNIDGPFFVNGWDVPFVSNYPQIIDGRQMGGAYWGTWQGGKIKWSVGAFNGTGASLLSPYTNPPDSPPNPSGNIQFDARVTVNFLDPEPGYYHQSSYYGKKDILALGFAVQTQRHALGTAEDPRNFTGVSLDALFETTLANDGVITVEGAVYRYDNQDLPTSGQQGDCGFIYVGYIIPQDLSVGPVRGRLRPFTRYQQYNHDFEEASTGLYSRALDLGVEYVINGPNARVLALWSDRGVVNSPSVQVFTLGASMVF